MHLYAISRGIKHEVDRVINELQGKYLKTKFGKEEAMLQLGVRPVQLWEFFFPAEHLDVVRNSLSIDPRHDNSIGIKSLRKLLKAKKLPPLKCNNKLATYKSDHVAFSLVGIREDKRREDGTEFL